MHYQFLGLNDTSVGDRTFFPNLVKNDLFLASMNSIALYLVIVTKNGNMI